MPAAGNPSEPDAREQVSQPVKGRSFLTLASYALAIPGTLLTIHDFHRASKGFGLATPLLGAAILLYLLGLARSGYTR